MNWVWSFPFVVQGLAIIVDEFYFHHQRRLQRWERIGHPLDTLSFLACLALACFLPWSRAHLILFLGASFFSCLLITKDEWIHAQHCAPAEHWLHAILFVIHPLSLIATAALWFAASPKKATLPAGILPDRTWASSFLLVQLSTLILFDFYQIVYWNLPGRSEERGK